MKWSRGFRAALSLIFGGLWGLISLSQQIVFNDSPLPSLLENVTILLPYTISFKLLTLLGYIDEFLYSSGHPVGLLLSNIFDSLFSSLFFILPIIIGSSLFYLALAIIFMISRKKDS